MADTLLPNVSQQALNWVRWYTYISHSYSRATPIHIVFLSKCFSSSREVLNSRFMEWICIKIWLATRYLFNFWSDNFDLYRCLTVNKLNSCTEEIARLFFFYHHRQCVWDQFTKLSKIWLFMESFMSQRYNVFNLSRNLSWKHA